MIRHQIFLFALLYFVVGLFQLKASDTIVFSNPNELLNIGSQVSILEDKTNQLTIEEVVHSKEFVKSKVVSTIVCLRNHLDN